jgi:DNA-binding LacI/PurR family transcriptional regulator
LPSDLTCAQDRLVGYYEAYAAAGRMVDEQYVIAGGLSESEGRSAATRLLNLHPRPTAIVACSDVMAFGAMQAIQQAGLRVGKDVSLIGFDDVPMAAHTNPPLTTIRQPIYDIGAQLVDMLINHIGNSDSSAPVLSRLIEPDLILRDSTRA